MPRTAAEELLESKRNLVATVVRRFMRKHGWVEIDDAEQIAAFAAWQVIEDPPAGVTLATAIYRNCWWRLVDELRTGHITGITRHGRESDRLRAISLNNLKFKDGTPFTYMDDLADEVDEIDQVELEADVEFAIACLTARQRDVVWLYFFEDLTQRSIAELLEVSEGRVCQILTDARRKLRPLLAA